MTPSLIHRLRLASWTVAVSALALLTLTLLFSSPSESRVADVLHLMALVLLLAAIAIRSFLIARSAPPRTAVPYGFVASIRGLLTRLLVALGLNLLFLLACGFATAGWAGLAAAMAVPVILSGWHAVCRRRIGGYTGDTLGASCELAETVPIVVLALWPALIQ